MEPLRFTAGDWRYALFETLSVRNLEGYQEVADAAVPTVIGVLRARRAMHGPLRGLVLSANGTPSHADRHRGDDNVWHLLEMSLRIGSLRLFRRQSGAVNYAPRPAVVAPAPVEPPAPEEPSQEESKPEQTSVLTVIALADDAKISLNGADTGKSRLKETFPRHAEVEIRAEAPGHQPVTKTVKLLGPTKTEVLQLKKETSIPEWQEDGNLPPGVHVATWEEVEERFGGTYGRNQLLRGLKRALDDLRRAGCRRVFLDGSFVTTKGTGLPGAETRDPGDFDGCWDRTGVDEGQLRRTTPFLDEDDLKNGRLQQQYKYGGEMFPTDHYGGGGLGIVDFFQRDKRSGAPKGIVAIDL
ncbi:MAG: hypothetical protein AAGF12_07910 [Myxococcota bacterium]